MEVNLSDILAVIALIVAIASATFTYVQTNAVKSQAELADLQIRPYVRFMPQFVQKGGSHLSVEEVIENFSQVPAHVIYSSLTSWLEGKTTGQFLFTRTGDILYEDRPATVFIPDMPDESASRVIQNKWRLEIGTCVVYASISDRDSRRWEDSGFYSYVPGSVVPETHLAKEVEVSGSTNNCTSGNLRSEWMALGTRDIR